MNFLKRLWKYRFIRALVWLVGSLLTLYALFHAWVNYHGAKEWTAAQARLKQEGETLDFRTLLLPPVPEEKNFCAIAPLKDLALVVDSDPAKGEPGARRKRLADAALPGSTGPKPSSRPRAPQGAAFGRPVDLKAWAHRLQSNGSAPASATDKPAEEVIAAMSKNDSLVHELIAGLPRPEAQWTPEWQTRELPEMLFAIPVPHYSAMMAMTPALILRATAAARSGDAATAHQCLLVTQRLAQASLNDPFLIGGLVACAQSQQLDHAIWEVCDAHAGSAEDFLRLQQSLSNLDFERGLMEEFRSELAAGVDTVLWMKARANPHDLDMIYPMLGSNEPESASRIAARVLFRLTPGGLFDLNAATMAQMEFDHFIKPLRNEGLRGILAQGDSLQKQLKDIPSYRLDKIFAKLTMPTLSQVVGRMVYAQSLNRQAMVACTLERWFFAHQAYPDSLAALGEALPLDPMTGKPMGYRKTPGGKYILWCVSLDGKDHGGVRELKAGSPESTIFPDRSYRGDWVWSYEP